MVFDAILFYYQSCGILSCPEGVSDEIFQEELLFFKIDDCRPRSEGKDIEKAKKFIKGDLLPTPEGRIRGMDVFNKISLPKIEKRFQIKLSVFR